MSAGAIGSSGQLKNMVVLALIWITLIAGDAFGQVAHSPALAGKLVEVKIPAPSLKGNLLGDATEQSVSIHLPPGYESSPEKRYPTVYLLHGFDSSNKSWTSDSRFGHNAPQVLDVLYTRSRISPMIIVFPNGRNALSGSFYVNSPVTGNWEDYIVRDVVGYVDSNYRTLARAASRGIGGHSMGGFGAISIAMKHPDVFGAVYGLSPCCLSLDGDIENDKAWAKLLSFKSREDLLKRYEYMSDGGYAQIFAAIGAAFSPNPSAQPFYADLPYRIVDGKLLSIDTVLEKWKARLPINMVGGHKPNLLSLRGIFIDVGQKEEFVSILRATPLLSKTFADHGISHAFEMYEGGTHGNKVRDRLRDRLFPFFSERLDFTNP